MITSTTSPSTWPHLLKSLSSFTPCTAISLRVSPTQHREGVLLTLSVAESVKSGIESAGGTTTIYQYVSCTRYIPHLPESPGSPKHCPMKSSQKCMLPQSQITLSSRHSNSPSSMPSSLVFQPVMETSLHSGKYVSDPLNVPLVRSNYTSLAGFLGRHWWIVGEGCLGR